jgi:hypothetical protein
LCDLRHDTLSIKMVDYLYHNYCLALPETPWIRGVALSSRAYRSNAAFRSCPA